MRQGDVERWVVRVVDQVDRGLRVEDDRVECKSKLIEPAKAARRIAGHANQVREDRILWIIGVDEARKPPVVGIEAGGPDPAEWWAQVESKFQDVAPSLTLVNVPISSDKSVLGLGFDTSRPPYVLKVASGEVNREVPWREGTRVRSANRVDLLKLLVPLAERPQVSVLDGWLEVVSDASSKELSWHGEIDLYVDCQAPVVFPDHRCAGRAVFDSGYETEFVVTPGAAIATAPSPSGVLLAAPSSPSALMAEQSCKQVVVRGSSPIWLTVRGSTNDDLTRYVLGDGRLDIELGTGGRRSIHDPAVTRPGTRSRRSPRPKSSGQVGSFVLPLITLAYRESASLELRRSTSAPRRRRRSRRGGVADAEGRDGTA